MNVVDIYENTKLKNFGKESVLDFIQTRIKNSNNVKEDILDKIRYETDEVTDGTYTEDMSSQGFYYERLWDLCIKFGVTDLTLPSINGHLQTSYIINENPNKTDIIRFQKNCWDGNKLNEYLRQNVRSGNSGGYSDITFLNKFIDQEDGIEKEDLYFISVKYFKEEKEISKYDIGKLCPLIEKHKKENRNIKLYIFVKNKKDAIAKFDAQNSSSDILIKYINPGGKYENIYDIKDLQFFYFKLKKLLEQYNYLQTPENIINDFEKNYLEVLKSVFIPRFHQELFILKINKLIDDGEKNILVGAIPRSGKSYIMAGTILEYVKKSEALYPGKKLKFLMMTPAPNETFGEYQAIFNDYIEFGQLGIDVITYKGDISLKNICSNKNKHCVIIISKQKLGWKAGSKAEKLLEKDDAGEDVDVDEDVVENEAEVEVEDIDVADADKEIKIIKQRITKLLGANPDINVMFLDEAHFGMSTEKAKKIVEVLNSTISNTIKIYVTATYNKPLQTYGVKSNCKLTWDMNDIKIMQKLTKETINDNPIKQQFGSDIYTEALEYYGDKSGETLIDKLKKEYAVYPKPYLITSLWDKEFLNTEKLKVGETEFGWDMNKLFATIGDSDNFANLEQLKEMMRYYFGYPDKKDNYAEQSFYRTRGILPRIRNICLNKCRTLQPNHKTTQLWFLPLGSGKIKNKIKALITLLTSNEFKDVKQNYHFFVAVDVEDNTKKGRTINADSGKNVSVTYMKNPREIKQDIEAVERKIKDGKIKADNLIILAGQRLQLGISLRNVDIVTLWNSISSADAIFQMLFRSMTEVDPPPCIPNEYCDQKSFGFMVDMNPERALTNVLLFGENITNKSDNDVVQKYRQITDLINIDEDVLYDKYGDNPAQKDEFVAELFNKLYTSWNINVENMKRIISKFSFDMTKLQGLKGAFEQIRIDKQKGKEDIDKKDEDEVFEPGKKKEKVGPNKQKKEKEKKEKEINLNEIATELITEFISLLNIFTLYTDKGSKCILTDTSNTNAQITLIDDINTLKNEIYKDPENKDIFLKILNGRLTGNEDEVYPEKVIDIVLDAMNNANDKQVMNKIIMSQKKQYYTINEPDELLEFINSELTPKEKEKKENGEVFTPLLLVNEMLDKLDQEYTKEHGKSIFTEKDFKWFDPAVGIGNFPIMIYQKLMTGLKLIITDEEERRKHILEKMLYMSELTAKNVFVCRKIFCGDTYKLNLNEGDTLKINPQLLWGVDKFDVILGNPPFQGFGRKKIYINFINNLTKNNLKVNGYFMFITPKLSTMFLLGSNISQQVINKFYNLLIINTSNKIKDDYFKNIGSDFMYFILQNSNYKNKTIVVYDDNTSDEKQLVFNSLLDTSTHLNNNNILNKLIKPDSNQWGRKAARISDNLVDDYNESYTHKILYKIKTDPKNDEIKWTNKIHKDMDKFKVLYPTLGNRIIIDSNRELFPGTSFVVYIVCETLNECMNIEKLMNSKLFKYLEKHFKTHRSPRDFIMRNLIKPSTFDIKIDNDQDIYNFFNLTPEEIKEIEQSKLKDESPPQEPIQEETIPELAPVDEMSYPVKNIDDVAPVDVKPKKIFNPSTNRFVNDTIANRKKIDKDKDKKNNTLKRGGKYKKTIRKNYKMTKYRTIKHKNRR